MGPSSPLVPLPALERWLDRSDGSPPQDGRVITPCEKSSAERIRGIIGDLEEGAGIMSDRIEGDGSVEPEATNGTQGAGPSGSAPLQTSRPLGAVIASAVDAFRTLARKHVELARIELTEGVSVRAKGVSMIAAAVVLALFALGFAAASGSAALDLVLPAWAAHLIVAAVFVVIAAALVLVGRRAMRTAPTTLAQTQQTLKEDARWAKQQIAR